MQTSTAQHACCVELACKLFHHTVSPTELLRYSGLGRASSYAKVLSAVSSSLALTPTLTIASLCIRHACPAVASAASNLLATYQQRLAASLPPAQRATIPLHSPPTVLAAFYCTARQQKVKADAGQLRQQHGVKPDEWRRVLQSYHELVGRESGMEDEHRRRTERAKRKRKAESAEADGDEVVDGLELDVEAAEAVPQLAGGRAVRYAEWRERVVADERRDEDGRRAKRRRRDGDDNEDDECEYGDDEEAMETRERRAPKQMQLGFAAVHPPTTEGRGVKGRGNRGGYTDVVVL